MFDEKWVRTEGHPDDAPLRDLAEGSDSEYDECEVLVDDADGGLPHAYGPEEVDLTDPTLEMTTMQRQTTHRSNCQAWLNTATAEGHIWVLKSLHAVQQDS